MKVTLTGISIKAGKGLISDPVSVAKFEAELEPSEVKRLFPLYIGRTFKCEPAELPLPLREAEEIANARND